MDDGVQLGDVYTVLPSGEQALPESSPGLVKIHSNSMSDKDKKNQVQVVQRVGTLSRSQTGGRPNIPRQYSVASPTAPSSYKVMGGARGPTSSSPAIGMDQDTFDREEFLEPDFPSYKAFAERSSNAAWIREPDTDGNIIQWTDQSEQELPNWILRPNAETDRDLMRAINGHDRGFTSNVWVNFGGHAVEKGEILFLRNNTHWEARGEGRYRWWTHTISVKQQRRRLDETLISMRPECPIVIIMILPGKIGIAKLNMEPVILLPGRHAFNNPLFEFQQSDICDITEPIIQAYTIKLINVKPNQVGFARHNNQYYLLKPGLHFSNDAAFKHVVTFNISDVEGTLAAPAYGEGMAEYKMEFKQAHLLVGTITLAQVHPSEYGCVYIEGSPKFLRPGFYARNSPSFNFERTLNSNLEHIHFGTLHILNIAKGRIAKITNRNQPLLVEGPMMIKDNSYMFEFINTVSTDEENITHRSITRFRIDKGKIGFAERKGIIEKLDAGIQTVDDPDFRFIGSFEEKKSLIRQGQYTLITVQDGHLAPVWVNGVLELVKPGFRLYQTPNIYVGPIVDLYPPIISFRKIDAFTRDRSQMQISGQLEYIVEDAHLLVTSIGVHEMTNSLEKRIHAIMRHHLAITDLSSISSQQLGVANGGIQSHVPQRRKKEGKKKSDGGEDEEEDGADFRDELAAQGTKELQADATRWGLRVIKMEVSDIHYKDESVEAAIADRTTQTRIAESDFDLSVVRNRQTIVEVEARARKLYIEAESKANQELLSKRGSATTFKIQNDILLAKKKTKVEADKLAVLESAKAQAAEVIQAAEASAQAIGLKAEAQKNATLKDAEGTSKLQEIEHMRYGGPKSLLKLEKMKLKVKMTRAMAKAAVPTVSLNATAGMENPGGYPGGGEAAMVGMMKTKGQHFLKTVAKAEAVNASATSASASSPKNSSPPTPQ